MLTDSKIININKSIHSFLLFLLKKYHIKFIYQLIEVIIEHWEKYLSQINFRLLLLKFPLPKLKSETTIKISVKQNKLIAVLATINSLRKDEIIFLLLFSFYCNLKNENEVKISILKDTNKYLELIIILNQITIKKLKRNE